MEHLPLKPEAQMELLEKNRDVTEDSKESENNRELLVLGLEAPNGNELKNSSSSGRHKDTQLRGNAELDRQQPNIFHRRRKFFGETKKKKQNPKA